MTNESWQRTELLLLKHVRERKLR